MQWLPLDERFDESKNRGFNGGLLEGIGPAVAGLLPEASAASSASSDSSSMAVLVPPAGNWGALIYS